jgi:hypothetical protein
MNNQTTNNYIPIYPHFQTPVAIHAPSPFFPQHSPVVALPPYNAQIPSHFPAPGAQFYPATGYVLSPTSSMLEYMYNDAKQQALLDRQNSMFNSMNVQSIAVPNGLNGPTLPLAPILVSNEASISDREYTNRAVSLNKAFDSLSNRKNAFSLAMTSLGSAFQNPE